MNGNPKKLIRWMLWSYFLLVVFEGALRKWIVPSLATPLLVVRDPICIAAIYLSHGHLLRNRWATAFASVGVIGLLLSLIVGHGDPFVALFGARIWLLHLPLIFLFPAVFEEEDLWKFVRTYSLIAIGMTILLGLQFYSPPSHILNVGVGGEGDSLFAGAGGRYRCSGTFSFTNGISLFFGLGGALFLAYLTSCRSPFPKWMWVSAGCLLIAMPLAISRTIAFQYAITVVFTAFAAGVSGRVLRILVPASLSIGIIAIALSYTPVFEDATDAFSKRWQSATRSEGGSEGIAGVVQNRVIDYGILSAFRSWDEIPAFGMGIGIGTNVGAKLLTGRRAFLVSEGSIGAMLAEFGPPLGLMVIALRLAFAISLGIKSLTLARQHRPAAIIIGSFVLHKIVMGDLGQPTGLGFMVFGSGLLLIAIGSTNSSTTTHSSYPHSQIGPQGSHN